MYESSPTSEIGVFIMAIVQDVVTVGTTPTVLYTSSGATQVNVQNTGGVDAFIGNVTVTTSNGFRVPFSGVGQAIILTNINLDHNESLYGIVASGTGTLRVLASRKS